MHVETVYSHVYPRDGLKGYCAILNKTKYVVINGKLKRIEQNVVGAHELAHLVRHKNELKLGAAFKDHDIRQQFLYGCQLSLCARAILCSQALQHGRTRLHHARACVSGQHISGEEMMHV